MASNKDFENVDQEKHGKMIEFLNSLKSVEIAGKKIIQLPDGEFAEYVLMEEEYFVDNWLTQFAIGFVNDRNYFDQAGWYSISHGYTKGVIVLNNDKEPVLVIRKFIDMDLSDNNSAYLQYYTNKIGANANFNPNKAEVDASLNELTRIIQQTTGQNEEYDTLTMMIPWEYYLSKGVNPYVMKQVIYIRDFFLYQGEPCGNNNELMDQVENILKRNAENKPLSLKEKNLISEITGNKFIFNDGPNSVETKDLGTAQKVIDPLSD